MRRAFTLLELLAATALSALLMVAVLHVLGTIGRDRRTMAARPGPQVWRADLLDTFRRDLAGSTAVRYGNNALVLTGQAALDLRTLAPRDEPVTVSYGLTTLHGRTWLTRRQGARNVRGNEGPWMELLCPDVVGFSVRAADAEPGTSALSDQVGDAPRAVPASAVLRIDIAGDVPVEETLVLR
jgi:prepilin-type N-terminal cleavage/methylation domain-containing protein